MGVGVLFRGVSAVFSRTWGRDIQELGRGYSAMVLVRFGCHY